MAHDLAESLREKIRQYKAAITSMEETLRKLSGAESASSGVLEGGKLIRKPTTWRTADAIERILERGKKSMKRSELIHTLVEQRLVGGLDDDQRRQYANESIRRGLLHGYLKEERGVVHWVPGVRKSRVTKKL